MGYTDGGGNTISDGPCMPDQPTQPTCPTDIAPPGGDEAVNVSDLLKIINDWGACPNP